MCGIHCDIWGCHGGNYEYHSLLRCDTAQFSRHVLVASIFIEELQWWQRQQSPLKHYIVPPYTTRLHGVMSQNTIIFIIYIVSLFLPSQSQIQDQNSKTYTCAHMHKPNTQPHKKYYKWQCIWDYTNVYHIRFTIVFGENK
jgi:hypothetical protein